MEKAASMCTVYALSLLRFSRGRWVSGCRGFLKKEKAERSSENGSEVKSAKESDLATAKSDLKDATDAHNTAAKVLQDTTTTCKTRADEWAERCARLHRGEARVGEIRGDWSGAVRPRGKRPTKRY